MADGDLILGDGWVQPVHHLPGQPFGGGPSARSSVVGALARQTRAMPQAPFLTMLGAEPPQTVSYAEAHRAMRQRVAALHRWGLARGERVGLLGQNSLEMALAALAVLEAGGVAVPLSPHDPAARVAAQSAFARVRFLLHDDTCLDVAQACAGIERACSFAEFARLAAVAPDDAATPHQPKPTDGALIFFTSGTTGAPKAVVQSHYAVARNALALAAHHRITAGTRLLCVLPLHHVNGLEFTIFGALMGGGQTVIARGFDGLRFWSTVRAHGIHIASLVPNLLRLLAERPGLRGTEPLMLRYIVSAAAPLSTAIARSAWEALGLRIVQGYGLSEVTNFSCLMPPAISEHEYSRWMLEGRRTSVGPALPGQEVEVHDERGAVAPGVEGEIVIRGHCVMSGYLDNHAATREAFHSGWFHSGDLGYHLRDDHGVSYLHVTGRRREIAKRSGVMVSLLELDEVLAAIPGVVDAGAAAFTNNWVDEEIAALVVTEPGSGLDEAALQRHCRARLPFAAIPKAIAFVDEVPRTASGKIRRVEIGQRFADLRERLFVERDIVE